MQIEAQPSPDVAEERARAYAALFPDVAGFATGCTVALTIPALNLRMVVSTPDDLPQDLEVIQTYNTVRDMPSSDWPAATTTDAPRSTRARPTKGLA